MAAFVFAGGDAFFWGVALLAIGAAPTSWRAERSGRKGFFLGIIVGWIVVASSATPLPLWFYGLGGTMSAFVLLSRRLKTAKRVARHYSRFVALLLLFWCIAGAGWELSYRFPPHVEQRIKRSALVVIGDSISAGLSGPMERTWPKQFRERYACNVVDLSREGATARSAIRQAQSLNTDHPNLDAVVLVEIGGNDYFELVPLADFATDLDQLLTLLERPERQIVMLELPLPPFYNAYGRIQRAMAAKHRIPMISKREFASVVFTPGATLDTVHLSEVGHGLMAALIERHVGRLLRQSSMASSQARK